MARIQAKIADSRKDFLHKLAAQLVRENQVIAVEDLAMPNMVKNRSLARSISDAGWGELVRQLEYKCQWYGRELVKIDRFFPSSERCGNPTPPTVPPFENPLREGNRNLNREV